MRPPVTAEIRILSSPKQVLSCFYDPIHLKGWWGVERSLIELKNGGLYSLAWEISEKGFKYVSSGTISRYEEDLILELENMVYFNPEKSILGPMKMSFEVTAINSRESLLRIRQDGYQEGGDWDWYYEAVKDAWPKALVYLKTYIEGLNS
jgi:uncharacterized protein YndB with AHSA1/START domain